MKIKSLLMLGIISAFSLTLNVNAAEKVAQIGDLSFDSINAAIATTADNTETTIKLISDTSEDVVVPAGKNIILDIGEHTLTNVAADTIYVTNGSTVTIEGTGVVDNVKHAKAAIFNNGKVILNGGKYTRSLENGQNVEQSGGNSYYNILNHGIMEINENVTIEQNGHFSSLFSNGYFGYSDANERSGHVEGVNEANPTMTINGGTFSGGLNTIKNDDGAIVTINGGTFKNFTQHVVLNHHMATINGGTFDGSAIPDNKATIHNCGCDSDIDVGKLNINGGKFIGNSTGKVISNTANPVEESYIKITGGTFTEDVTKYLYDNTYYVSGSEKEYTVDRNKSVDAVDEEGKSTGNSISGVPLPTDVKLVVDLKQYQDKLLKKLLTATENKLQNLFKESTLRDVKFLKSYDINLVNVNDPNNDMNYVVNDKGDEFEVTLAFSEEDAAGYNAFKVAYINDNDEVKEIIDATYEDGKIKFTTTHLSSYSVIGYNVEQLSQGEEPVPGEPTPTDSVKSPDTFDGITLTIILGAVCLCGFTVCGIKLRNKAKNM